MKMRGFTLDAFQARAITLLEQGHSVLVSAPTGTGKTIVADYLVAQALSQGRRVIYTAPIKALSNQKFRDWCREHGEQNVGLVTGDLVIRREAPCLVMTTEILRNMLLDDGDGTPKDLAAVILDEIHFLDDRERGTVWEEVLIYLPKEVRVLGLSATLSNLTELTDWLSEVRGETVHVIEEHKRAVPLEVMFANRETGPLTPEDFDRSYRRWKKEKEKQGGGHREGGRRDSGRRDGGRRQARDPDARPTRHFDIFRMIIDDKAPYLYFVFSRRFAEEFARSLDQKVRGCLLPAERRHVLNAQIDDAIDRLGEKVIDAELERIYRKGIAFHHAGLHVQLKALVEELYEQKLIAVLYTTSTFALGINMPARTVVLDGIKKFDGRSTNPLTVREFMQKAGRAGRRGMDTRGYVIVRMDFEDYGQSQPFLQRYLAGHPERVDSSFNLSFNSVVCLIDRYPMEKVRQVVERSFLAFRMRRETVRMQAEAEELESQNDKRSNKELRKLRRKMEAGEDRAWQDFEVRRNFLIDIGYLAPDNSLNAGARVLRNVRIEEIFATELVLAGVFDMLDPAILFAVLCGMSNTLPPTVSVRTKVTPELRKVAQEVNAVRRSPAVTRAEAITGVAATWDPELLAFGEMWARGHTLAELQLLYWSGADIAGQLISGFRRAKDLVGQLLDVYREDPLMAGQLRTLLKTVTRDEVEVVD